MTRALIVVAAGSGERLQAGVDKPFVQVNGHPLVWYALHQLDLPDLFEQRVAVVAAGAEERFRTEVLERHALHHAVQVVTGGATRQASVAAGLAALSPAIELVAIHDGARPCVDPQTVRSTFSACTGVDGAIVAVPVHDALKRVEGEFVVGEVDRAPLWRAQTPQTFWVDAVRRAHATAAAEGTAADDDAAVVLAMGGRLRIVQGSKLNFKVTEPIDLRLASLLVSAE